MTATRGTVRDRASWKHALNRRARSGSPAFVDENEIVHSVVARAREGDREALGELYARYSQSVFYCVYRILQDTQDAEDVTQQVFLKLISALGHYHRRASPFPAWLMRVARNAALDAQRKRHPVLGDDVLGADPRYDDCYQRERSIQDALAALPASQRRVVLLRHVVGLSAPEIAARLGKTPGSIHALDQRARRTLQEDLIALGSAPVTQGRTSRASISVAA